MTVSHTSKSAPAVRAAAHACDAESVRRSARTSASRSTSASWHPTSARAPFGDNGRSRARRRHPRLSGAALLRGSRAEQPSPPGAPRTSCWSQRPFPLRPGQQRAGRPLLRHALGVRMSATFTVALRKQQGVGIHRQQQPVADRTGVGLRLPAPRRTHLPPAHWLRHSARLRPVVTQLEVSHLLGAGEVGEPPRARVVRDRFGRLLHQLRRNRSRHGVVHELPDGGLSQGVGHLAGRAASVTLPADGRCIVLREAEKTRCVRPAPNV